MIPAARVVGGLRLLAVLALTGVWAGVGGLVGCDEDEKSQAEKKAEKEAAETEAEQDKLRLRETIPPPPSADAPKEAPIDLLPAKVPGSYRAIRPVAVYREPSTKAKIRGAIKKFTRLPRVEAVEGKGCAQGFLKLAENAYVCMLNLRKDKRSPRAKRQPTLGANNLTPGTYGYIRTGGAKLYGTLEDGYKGKKGKPIQQSDTVRWAGKRFFKGMKFWRITTGQYVRGTRVRRFWPSRFKGVHLIESKRTLPLVFIVSRRRRKIGEEIPPVPVRREPGESAEVVGKLKRYTAWPADRVVKKGEWRWFHIPEKGWVSSELTAISRLVDPPKGLHPRERWLDIDLDEQILTAYRGRTPIYTTLVSAGVWKYPTPHGSFRIYHKVAQANMKSDPTADEQYRADHVPWSMYFKKGYALHGTYWHDGFGHPRSHGCINLAPKDAMFVYHFTCPKVPKGWTALYADEDHPGTLIRIRGTRSEKEKKILEQRDEEEKPRDE
jgi:hypothetical protein